MPTDLPTATMGFNANATTAYPFGFSTVAVPTIGPGVTATSAVVVPAVQPSPTPQSDAVVSETATAQATAFAAGGTEQQPPTPPTSGGGSLRDPLLFVLVCAVVGAIIWKLRQRQAAQD